MVKTFVKPDEANHQNYEGIYLLCDWALREFICSTKHSHQISNLVAVSENDTVENAAIFDVNENTK